MEYIIIVLAFILCSLVAYYIVKIKLNVFIRLLINITSLLAFGILIIASGVKETALLIYVLLLAMTLFGMLMRIIAPIILNLVASFVAKITKQSYEWLTYNQLMHLEQSGYKMYFCVFSFTTLKVMLYLLLVASLMGII